MNDNKSAYAAAEYDQKIRITIPDYDRLHAETIDLVKTINPTPARWLDTGCGTGNLSIAASKTFKSTVFVLADPSNEMLAIAKNKTQTVDITAEVLEPVPTQGINLPTGNFEVITAIRAHHYLNAKCRKEATENCFRMLIDGGVYITAENIRPFSNSGIKTSLERWKRFQISKGKSIEEAEKHAERFEREYFSITVDEHIGLLKNSGFYVAEIFWFSYMQAGFYAVKK
jgi:tRNA (cmo5U34)-methyltransferase